MRRTYVIGLVLGTGLLLGGFQNCGKLGFSTGSSSSGGQPASPLGIAAASLGNFACGGYQELKRRDDGTLADVPARANDGTCYFVKVISAVDDASAAVPEAELIGRSDVRRLAAGLVTFTLLGERAVELTNSITLPGPVDVSDVLVAGLYAAGTVPDLTTEFAIHGDPGCAPAESDQVILNGVTLKITPITDLITVGAAVDANQPFTLDLRAATCGQAGHVSDVFAIFR